MTVMAYLVHKLLLKGTVLTHVTHNLSDLWPLLNSLEGVTAAHGFPHTLSATLSQCTYHFNNHTSSNSTQ